MGSHINSADVRATLDHPVIDADGHVIEYPPTLWDFVAEEGGPELADRFRAATPPRWYAMTEQERRARREPRPGFWVMPTENVRDHAAAMFPALLEERRQELGVDFSLIYPSEGLNLVHVAREDVRRPACRAVNRYQAEIFAGYHRTICPVGVIPMHTPDEAIEELEAGTALGLRAFMFPSNVVRSIPAAVTEGKRAPGAFWIDTYGIDSDYDYDPVWQRCVELGVVPAFHSGSTSWTPRRSISNYVFNHVGHFAAANDTTAKSLLLGGVTRRFPTLRFAFLEGGVGWACALLGSLVEHWEKRGGDAVLHYAPERFDRDQFAELFDSYAPEAMAVSRDRIDAAYTRLEPGVVAHDVADDFANVGIATRGDFVTRFVTPFAFGCEADDPLVPLAFHPGMNPLGVPLDVIFSSDIGHWDVPDITEILEEAFEAVEAGLITDAHFRDFTCANVAEMYTAVNPDFFAGTVVATDVEQIVAERRAARAPAGAGTAA